MIPKWPRRVKCPYPKWLAHSHKSDSFNGKIFKMENPPRLIAILSYVSTYIKINPKSTEGNLVSYLIKRKAPTYMTDVEKS